MRYLPIALVLFLLGCNQSEKKENESTAGKEASEHKEGKFYDEKFGNCDTVSNKGSEVVIHLWQPVGSGEVPKKIWANLSEKVVERINSHADSVSVADTPEARKSPRAASEVFITNYTDFKKDFPEAPGCWEIGLKGDTVMVTPKIMLYQFDHYAFTGGAHPNSFRSYHVFDLNSGDEIESRKYISDSVALLKKVEIAFRKEEKLDAKTDLEEAGYFLLDHKFFISANYTFTKDGLFFYYNPYEIAAYARGAITFTIPYSELDGVVKRDMIF